MPGRRDRAKPIARRLQIESFHAALAAYHADVGRFPATAEGLEALRQPFAAIGWKGPYLAAEIPVDPWGISYRYQLRSPDQPVID
ncbi:MAG: type II secretion system protein GspG [Bryobacteraceae bacterium]